MNQRSVDGFSRGYLKKSFLNNCSVEKYDAGAFYLGNLIFDIISDDKEISQIYSMMGNFEYLFSCNHVGGIVLQLKGIIKNADLFKRDVHLYSTTEEHIYAIINSNNQNKIMEVLQQRVQNLRCS